LEQKNLAPSTINVRLAAVRRLAYEASDTGRCGLRRAEGAVLKLDDLQQREDHWIIADLIGKGKHVRTVPVGHDMDAFEGQMRKNSPAWSAFDIRMMFQGYLERGFAAEANDVGTVTRFAWSSTTPL
jgi:hypothetical protein